MPRPNNKRDAYYSKAGQVRTNKRSQTKLLLDVDGGGTPPVATAPAAFADDQWEVVQGPGPSEVTLRIFSFPADGGSPITRTDYNIGSGWVILPNSAEPKEYVLTLPAEGTDYDFRVRARNAVGISPPGVTKSVTSGEAVVSAQRLIVNSDMAGDCDDAAALAEVAYAHLNGDINLLGVVATSTLETSAPAIRAQLDAYGLESIPVYAYQGSVGTYNDTGFTAALRDQFGVPGQTRAAFVDDITGLRTMLAAAPDASVKVVDVGAPVSGARLLDSPADDISPLTGMQLVAAKVVGLWQMAGEFTTTRVEYNANRHVPSTQRVYHDWPTPVYAHGAEVGADLFTGPGPTTSGNYDPVKLAFDVFDLAYSGLNDDGKRQSWDPAALFDAVFSDSGLFGRSAGGTITVSASGVTSWSATPAGNRYITTKAAPNAEIEAAMQALIDAMAIPMPFIDFTLMFDEGAGTMVIADEGAPVFSMSAGATWMASPAHIDFNGTSGRLTTPGNDEFVAYDMLIGAVWRVDAAGTRMISAINGTQGRVYQFRTNGNLQWVSFAPDTTATVISSAPNPPVGQWGLAVALVTDTSVVLRLNGVEVGAGTFPQRGKVMGTHPLVIGARSFDGVAFSDHLDGGVAFYRHKTGATAADIADFEADLRALAASKDIVLP